MSAVTLTTVKMQSGSTNLKLESPFHPSLSPRLRALGGKWDAARKVWYIPVDLEAQVREICREIYGVDPLADTGDLVTVRWDATALSNMLTTNKAEYWELGRQILRRPDRDSAVRVGDGVSIVGGGFLSRGGSAKYPYIGNAKDGTILVVRDVPRAMAEAFAQANPEYNVEIVAQGDAVAPIVRSYPLEDIATEALIAELARRVSANADPLARQILAVLDSARQVA